MNIRIGTNNKHKVNELYFWSKNNTVWHNCLNLWYNFLKGVTGRNIFSSYQLWLNKINIWGVAWNVSYFFLSILVHKILHNNNTTSFLPFHCKPRKQPWPNPSMTVLYWRKSRLKRWKGRGSKKRNLKNIEEKLGIEHNYLSYLKD